MTTEILQEKPLFSVGQTLKAARVARGLTLDQVSKKLCISKRQLSSLEDDEEILVCDVYKLGFVKIYAQYLELNTQDLMAQFKERTSHNSKIPSLTFPAPLPGRGMPNFRILVLSLFVLIACIMGWKWLQQQHAIPSPSQEMTLHETLGEKPLEATQETRSEVLDKEFDRPLSKDIHLSDSYDFNDINNTPSTTESLQRIYLSSIGKTLPIFGKSAAVRQETSLELEKWLEPQPKTY